MKTIDAILWDMFRIVLQTAVLIFTSFILFQFAQHFVKETLNFQKTMIHRVHSAGLRL